jgi:hypothetical protein
MPVGQAELTELKHAYQVLGVPVSASAAAIKHAYRRLAKRWHPDRCPSGTPAYGEATHMMKLINEAYTSIAHAPLRYRIESYPRQQQERRATANDPEAAKDTGVRDTLPMTDRFEFWVRFAFGAVVGALWCFRLFIEFFDYPKTLAVAIPSVVVLCGLGAARYGDKVWLKIFRWWW